MNISIHQKIFSKLHTVTIGQYHLTFYDLWQDKFCFEFINDKNMSSVPVKNRNHVLAFVALKHVEQKRKYTGDPYLFHLQSVAKIADGKCRLGYEIALCHDLLEDTDCEAMELYKALIRFGYSDADTWYIVTKVIDLTDIYTHEAAPDVNRKLRKHLEAQRLHNIHPDAQTVKYCDIIDNTSSITKHDKGFARVYLSEISEILYGMDKGDPVLYKQAKEVVSNALTQIN